MKQERREAKRTFTKICFIMLAYNLIMLVGGIIWIGIASMREAADRVRAAAGSVDFQTMVGNVLEDETFITELADRGTMSIVAVAFGMILILAWKKKAFFKELFLRREKKMDGKTFLCLLCIFMSIQAIIVPVYNLAEGMLNYIGYTMESANETASGISTNVSMFLYAGIIGPVAEELIFRGAVLSGLKPYGKRFAIVFSSILFGIFHGNLVQIIFAGLVGMILGYVAVEYSIWWSILIHILNNAVFGDGLGYLLALVKEPAAEGISYGILGAFLVAAVVICIRKQKEIKAYYRENRIEKRYVKYFLTSIGMIVFTMVMVGLGITDIVKM